MILRCWRIVFSGYNFFFLRHAVKPYLRLLSGILDIYETSLKQATFEDFITKVNKWAPTCPNFGRKMTFTCYEKGPPVENEVFGCKLADWNHLMLSPSYN